MATINKHLAAVAFGLAVAAAAATPSFAQRAEQNHMNPARERAIQECSVESTKKAPQSTWGVQQLQMYRSCMGQHGMEQE
jgi:hypothetical protein